MQRLNLFCVWMIALWFIWMGGCGEKTDPLPDGGNNRTEYTISKAEWTETAVRKVLHTFAYGGFASDQQIKAWSEMEPQDAIEDILSAKVFNKRLSPPDPVDNLQDRGGTLQALRTFWASTDASNPTHPDAIKNYSFASWNVAAETWFSAVKRRGLNPVRQALGFWETNYHLCVNLSVGVSPQQALAYYDRIMDGIAENKPYQTILAEAALSAAVATQYNHKDNVFKDGKFSGNEDFAREFHQLFFGILGGYDHPYHEFTTIRNTAKALTDMVVVRGKEGTSSFWDDQITYGTKLHYPGGLEILKQEIGGNSAKEKIEKLAAVAIQHSESLANLPVIIVNGLADDNLNDEKLQIIRKIWADLQTKDLLAFLRRYAISTAFHNATRVKYWSSINRLVLTHNLMSLGNKETYLGAFDLSNAFYNEGVSPFRPNHDVFGSQTGREASLTADIFKRAYNRSVSGVWEYVRISITDKQDKNKILWEKDWTSHLPKNADGSYRVKDTAEWLWNRFVADGLKNFGSLERAHVYALLASGSDFAYWINKNDPLKVYTKTEIETDRLLIDRIQDVEKARLDGLSSADAKEKQTANKRIGLAIAFITATPYMFAQEGK